MPKFNVFKKNRKEEDSELFFVCEKKNKNFVINSSDKFDLPEESMALNSGFLKNKGVDSLGCAISDKKLNLFLFLIFIGLFILAGKVSYMQVIKGKYYQEIADGNRIRIERIKTERGIIYDRTFKPLVKNVPYFALFITPADLPKNESERREVVNKLSEIIKVSPDEILQTIEKNSKSYEPLLLKENLTNDEAIQSEVASASMPGVRLEIDMRREYLNTGEENQKILSLSHILGYEGKITKEEIEINKNESYFLTDYIGKTGLEYYWEDFLRGKDGKKQIEVDAMGKEKKILATLDPRKGDNLVLTIDLKFQEKLEKILNKHLKVNNRSRGAAVALDPQTGEILALVSLPSFDNNIFIKGMSENEYQSLINNSDKPLFTRAISGAYPSGSTIKPVIAAAALEEGIINRNTTFLSTGGIYFDKWFFPDWKSGGHGPTNVIRAIAESVNTFFYIIGGGYENFDGLGVEKMKKYAELFGLGNKLNIDLPFEVSGLLPNREWKEKTKGEEWYIGDTYHFAIGQGDVLVTPLQITSAMSVFANGGTLYRPHVVREIVSKFGQPSFVKPQIIRKDFISEQNIDIVRQGLRQAVISGSAIKLQNLKVSSAGKTGTAQGQTGKLPHAWFTGFAPFSNPEIVITVLVEEGGEGSGIALDVAYEFLDWYFNGRGQI